MRTSRSWFSFPDMTPTEPSSEPASFGFRDYRDGAAEALLTTLIDQWPKDVPGLIVPGATPKWMLFSAIGPGDCRGYIEETDGSAVPLILEIKNEPTRASYRDALAQTLIALDTTLRRYAEELREWHRVVLARDRAIIAVAGARFPLDVSWLASEAQQVVERAREGRTTCRGKDFELSNLAELSRVRVLTLEIDRHRDADRRLISSSLLLDESHTLTSR